MNPKVINFTDLKVWQLGHQVVLAVYAETKSFPRDELFGLISQLRRAVVSITSNIAEGFSRSTARDKIHFYTIVLGSITEVQNQLLISKDLYYLKSEAFNKISNQLVEIHKMVHGLIKSASNRP